ncbi:MAG: c-type cytochrome domain-containing protein, partial [Bacteroidota bacterium]|nr:c-type cytochrome domain-containing protein [Bacteroidota bacterium]
MPRSVFLFLLPLCYCLCSCGPNLPRDVQQAYDELPRDIDYNRMVKPILSDKCFTCHGPDRAKIKAGLRLDMAESAYGELPESPGKVAIDPGSPDGSELYYRILSKDPQYKMPLPESHLQLSAREKAILIKWIEKGAV